MAERLIVTVNKNNKPWFALYFHWGAENNDFIKSCVDTCNNYLKGDEDLYTNLCLAMNHLEMSGLATHKSWFCPGYWEKDEGKSWYEEEFPLVREMLEKGIPAGTNRNEGLILLGEKTIDEAQSWAEWIEYIDL